MVCREWTRVKPRQIGSCSIIYVLGCQRTFCNFNHWCGWIYSCSVQQDKISLMLDGNLNFNDQVKSVCRASFFHIRALRPIRPSLTEEISNVVLVLLFSHELTTLFHSTQEWHLLILTNCSWCRTHLHALFFPPGNGTTSSHRSRDCTGYRSVNVSISRLHCWHIQFVILVNFTIWIRCWFTKNQLDLYVCWRTVTCCFTYKIIFHFSSFRCRCTKTLE